MNELTRRMFCRLAGGLAVATAAPVAVVATPPVPLDARAAARVFIAIWREEGNRLVLTSRAFSIVGPDCLRVPPAEKLALLAGFCMPDLLPYIADILAAEGAKPAAPH